MNQQIYPNLPKDTFPFEYGSSEWSDAHFEFSLELNLKRHELLKNCSNKIPDEALLNTVRYLCDLPRLIEQLITIENPTEEDCRLQALFTSRLNQAKVDIAEYMSKALTAETDTQIKKLIEAKKAIKTVCALGLPIPADQQAEKIGGVKNIAQTIREIVYDWYGEDPPNDWLVTYSEISRRHNQKESRPSDDDLKKYLKKIGLARLPNYKQD